MASQSVHIHSVTMFGGNKSQQVPGAAHVCFRGVGVFPRAGAQANGGLTRWHREMRVDDNTKTSTPRQIAPG